MTARQIARRMTPDLLRLSARLLMADVMAAFHVNRMTAMRAVQMARESAARKAVNA